MTPTTETELSEAVASATGPLRIEGGGTRPVGRPVEGEVLSVGGLSGVELYEPGALTIVVRAGTPLAEVEAVLASENQRLPFEPMDHRVLLGTGGEPTIGGVVAANVSGPRRIQAGACRDSLIGVRFVDGTGTILKNGGRVMKNVTGYDLVKLLAGSRGTLGVLTEVAFKVLPATETQACVVIDGLGDLQAVEAMAVALGSPFEVTGAAHLPAGPEGVPLTMLRLEGFAASVAYRTGRLLDLLKPFGAVRAEVDPVQVGEAWLGIRDVLPFAGSADDVWRLSVRPTDAPGIAALTGGEVFYDWGGGLIWARVPQGTDLRARLGAYAGHATLVRASAETRARIAPFQPEPAPIAALSEGLRRKFDPRGILNPGLMAA
ncbi:FAD-binding protein [Roseibacterium sp. SDUM158016]|uniref:FAD-binding protein n=1 Tax=Roseicyclus sediminis TaxID=2980997 RepID=UPI0021D0BDE1|nr:FAD-binding protein [Roseibacterium sp. SDUM158016]MCU4651334.1 FAD-binding protein [Roseibacterium sp. SDUM158016]